MTNKVIMSSKDTRSCIADNVVQLTGTVAAALNLACDAAVLSCTQSRASGALSGILPRRAHTLGQWVC